MASILLYHAVSNKVVDESLQVRSQTIDRHLDWCRELGYEVVPLMHALEHSAEPLVAVTFDDGFASTAETVRRLIDRGIIPTMFVCPGMIGTSNSWASAGRFREPLLDLDAILRLKKLGLGLCCHSWDHRAFLGRTIEDLSSDLVECHVWFQTTAEIIPDVFAWPFGLYDNLSVEAVGRHYRHALAVEPSWGAEVSPLAIPRVVLFEDMNFATFADALELSSFVFDPDARRPF